MRYVLLAVALLGCGDGSERPSKSVAALTPAPKPDARPPSRAGCLEPRFSVSLPIAEASGAVYLPADEHGPARIMVVGDSGNGGPYLEMAADDGRVLSQGKLPLDDGASDDLEGFEHIDGRFYGITSSGYIREWVREGKGFKLDRPAYPLAEPGHGKPPISCADPMKVNCGSNFEGLCLRKPRPASGCAGYAVSKETGWLLCLRWAGDRLTSTRDNAIEVSGGDLLSGCTFRPDTPAMLVGSNMFAVNAVYEIEPGADPRFLGRLGPGFAEAIAAGPNGEIYRFSDTGSAPSGSKKFVCP